MFNETKIKPIKTNLIAEINGGFPHFWLFIIPVDLYYYKDFYESCYGEECLEESNLSKISDNIGLDILREDNKDIIQDNSVSSLNLSYEDSANKAPEASPEEISKNKSKYNQLNSFNYDKNSLKGVLDESLIENKNLLFNLDEEGKVKENIINLDKCIKTNKEKNDFPLSHIKNYNINIYNPNINCINISYPPLPCSPFSSTSKNSVDKTINSGAENNGDILTEKLPLNFCCHNSKNINDLISSLSYNNSNNNFNFLMNYNFKNLGENISVNYLQNDFCTNVVNNNNDNMNIKNILNNNENENSNTTKKPKKNKKKKKKKIDDDYTVEMFGRRGWICQGCNNFNYESRKNCNRCKIPKNPLKRSVIMDNKGNLVMGNLVNTNHKDDWNCYNCGNVNYAFRLNCNRCQMKKGNTIEESKEDK